MGPITGKEQHGPREELGQQRPPGPRTRQNRSSMKIEVETSGKQVKWNVPLPKAAPARVSWSFPSETGTRTARPAAAPGGHSPCGGRLAGLETRATERHKVHSAEHKDYARTPALTWKNSQRNTEVHYSAPG